MRRDPRICPSQVQPPAPRQAVVAGVVTDSALTTCSHRVISLYAVSLTPTDDEQVFTALVEGYRRQLHVHCYRMVGSFDDAEDLVQETFLRAWRARGRFEGRSLVRTVLQPGLTGYPTRVLHVSCCQAWSRNRGQAHLKRPPLMRSPDLRSQS
jgi:hypothetical protein